MKLSARQDDNISFSPVGFLLLRQDRWREHCQSKDEPKFLAALLLMCCSRAIGETKSSKTLNTKGRHPKAKIRYVHRKAPILMVSACHRDEWILHET